MYWNNAYERMDRDTLKVLQQEKLKSLINRVFHNVPHYKNALQERGISPNDIRSLEDIKHLPFTVKTDLRDNYPYGLYAESLKHIIRHHASSGTTGKPTVVGYTRNDLTLWQEMVARSLVAAGANADSIIQNAYGYGLFTGGLGIHDGAQNLGASVIPISGGNTEKQLMMMEDMGTTMLTCTPSYANFLGDKIKEYGIDRNRFKLKTGVFGGEPWTDELRKELEEKLQIEAFDIYGLSEIYGPGVGIECAQHDGLHIWEDHFYLEIIDPNTLEVLPVGAEGELVITTLSKEGMPLLRYRTRDITHIIEEPCPCGRTHRRIARLSGRTDDMLIIRGVNVFPTQIESALLSVAEVAPYYQLVVKRDGVLDTLDVHVELAEGIAIEQIRQVEDIRAKIKEKIASTTGIRAKIVIAEPRSLPRTEGKSVRVIDQR